MMSVTDSSSNHDIELEALNPPQAEAVAHAHGPLIVFAGAGSGKTRVITYRIANLVATHSVPPYRILAVTFTNKAAGEMRERLIKLLGRDMTRSLWIGTFHAVCVRLIRRYHESIGLGQNFVIYDDSDQKSVMKRVMKDLEIDERRYAPQKILARIQREKQEARGPEDFSIDGYFDEVIKRCYDAYQTRLQEANAADFSDLLLHVLRLAESDSEAAQHLCARFSHVLVDEFQDTNLVQYRLVRALAGDRRNICVVGDDDQSIYRWRGADIRNIRGFTRDYQGAKLVKLEQNYRSTKNVVHGALGVIRLARGRTPKELWTGNADGDPIKVVHSANERDEAAYVVEHVQRLIAEGVSPSDMAVFYRTHAQSRVLEEAMRARHIPYQIVGGLKFFDRAEVKDLLSYLRIIVNPASDVDLLRVINKPARKIGSKTIEKLADVAKEEKCSLYDAIVGLCSTDRIGAAAKKSLRGFDEMISGFIKAATTASPRELAEDVLNDSGYLRWLQGQDTVESDSRIENLREVMSSIADYEEEMGYAGEDPSLADYLTRISLVADADTLEDVPRVPMMTVHAAKGLEFEAVFLTGMEERLFPLRGQEPGEEEELEEERRLAYVAITRAKRWLHVSHANTRMIYGQVRYNQPSRFLGDLPPANQQRVATDALEQLAKSFTSRADQPSWRELIRARTGSTPAPARRAAERPPAPAHRPGERFIDRDEDAFIDQVFDDVDMDIEPTELRVGSRVRHPKFGLGQVQVIDRGFDPAVTVNFEAWGPKRIKLRFLTPA